LVSRAEGHGFGSWRQVILSRVAEVEELPPVKRHANIYSGVKTSYYV